MGVDEPDEPSHEGRIDKIDWQASAMQPILASITWANSELPKQMEKARPNVQQLQVHHTYGPMQDRFDAMATELKQVRQHVSRIPDTIFTQNEKGEYIEVDPTNIGRRKVVVRKVK
jgi:hypothetical protein